MHELNGTFGFEDVDDHWSFQLAIAGPVADMAASLDTGELAETKKALAAAMEPHKRADGYALSSHLIGVVAT